MAPGWATFESTGTQGPAPDIALLPEWPRTTGGAPGAQRKTPERLTRITGSSEVCAEGLAEEALLNLKERVLSHQGEQNRERRAGEKGQLNHACELDRTASRQLQLHAEGGQEVRPARCL